MSCPFCSEMATGLPPAREGVTIPSRRLWETPHFVMIADISPLVVGHVIIIPRAHILSFGSIPQEFLAELSEFILKASEKLAAHAFPPVVLEHGSDSLSDTGGCVAHAHLHLVPAPLDMRSPLGKWQQTEISSMHDLRNWAQQDIPYVYVGDPHGAGVVADRLVGIPKQFLRIEVARQVGLADPLWDWRTHILDRNLRDTVELFLSEARPI